MSMVTASKIGWVNSYCSLGQKPIIYTQDLNQCIAAAQAILQKDLLCLHDVSNMNAIFRTLKQIEKNLNPIPAPNSHSLLIEVIGKITQLLSEGNWNASHLISLYHLKDFEGLPGIPFIKKRESYQINTTRAKELAVYLPYCHSSEHLNSDIASLIGNEQQDEEIGVILNQKRKILNAHENLIKGIQRRQTTLTQERVLRPDYYPPYLRDILNAGCIFLYDHLVAMRKLPDRNARYEALNEMTFSDISHIVLETRKVIFEEIASAIPQGHHQILFILGDSGAGKSTAFCRLRGDRMNLRHDYNYESTDDQNQLIGFKEVTSCTFLPSVCIVNGLLIVDFQGFDDTHGPLGSLGAECALKALIAKYPAKILLLVPITNVEGRYKAVAQLGARLSRLFDDKGSVVLGTTKYTKDGDFREIRSRVNKQREAFLTPSAEETKLIGIIEYLSEQPDMKTDEIEIKRLKLKELERERLNNLRSPLVDMPEIEMLRAKIQAKENELLMQIGLKKLVKFSDLEDVNQRELILEELSQSQSVVQATPKQILDTDMRRLLKERLEKQLLVFIESEQSFYNDFKDVKAFEQRVLETSLTSTLLAHIHPEIGQFLHLPEVDPELVKEFDKLIVDHCIDKCIENVIDYPMALVGRLLTDLCLKGSKTKIEQVQQKYSSVKRYIMGILGYEMKDSQQAEDQWQKIIKQHQGAIEEAINQADKKFKLSTWAIVLLAAPAGIPLGIRTLIKNRQRSRFLAGVIQQDIDKYLDECFKLLELTHDALKKLKNIENVIAGQKKSSKHSSQ